MYIILTSALLLWQQVRSIQILDLQVPGHAAENGSALLGCQYDLEGEELYSVKWYKDEREFYRYVPSNSETTSCFSTPGVVVDVSRSSSTIVALERLQRDSAGVYRCEVSGEAPYFVTVFDQKAINIHLLPRHSPKLLGLQTEYHTSDLVAVNCTSSRSRPPAQIKWLINDRLAPEGYIRGPWIRLSRERTDAYDTTTQVSFVLTPEHFVDNRVIIQCQVSIAPLYQSEVLHEIQRIQDIPIDANEDIGGTDFSQNTNFVISAIEANDASVAFDGSERAKAPLALSLSLITILQIGQRL